MEHVGIIGLGNMGTGVARRCLEAGMHVWGYDPYAAFPDEHASFTSVSRVADMVDKVRCIVIMVPAGAAVDETIVALSQCARDGLIVIDGGNSHFRDSIRHHTQIKDAGMAFLDAGISGGVFGERNGYSIMVGGEREVFARCEPFFQVLAAPGGYGYMGPAGAGHYVKMVHNGIEYSLLQAYAEGFHLLREGRYENLDMQQIARVWGNGSIIQSFILHLIRRVYQEREHIDDVSGHVAEGGTGRWTYEEAEDQAVAMRMLREALAARAESRQGDTTYATKLIALLRNAFGDHPLYKGDDGV